MSRYRRKRREGGFTLIEMMMAMAIMGIIVIPMTATVFIGLRTTDETSTRLAGSNDAQLLSVWLPADVQSTGNQSGDVVASPTANTECSGVSNLLRLKWRETQGSTTNTYVAAYAMGSVSGGVRTLKRYFCVNGGTATTHLVGRNLSGSVDGSVSVSGTKVSMTLTQATAPHDPTAYTFTVSANRRTP
jgi:prepilin-type N-terminal cleavage/methylation domain-containing protein